MGHTYDDSIEPRCYAWVAQALGISVETLDGYPFDLDDNAGMTDRLMAGASCGMEMPRRVSTPAACLDYYDRIFPPHPTNRTGMMPTRKVRGYDAELKALEDKARALKARRVEQLGTLVAATGADALDAETLAGVLLAAVASTDAGMKEAWRTKGAAFFQRRGRKGGRKADGNNDGGRSQPGTDPAPGSDTASR